MGDSLPPPLRKLWEPERTLRSRVRGEKCRSGHGRLASGLRGLWSVTGGLRPTPLPSLKRRPCCQGAMQLPAGFDFLCRRGLRSFAPRRSMVCVTANLECRSPTGFCNACRRCSSREAPRSVVHTVALFEECNSGGRVGRENDSSAVGMLCKTRKACAQECKTRFQARARAPAR